MSDAAVKAFESLLESVPSWIAELDSILRIASEKQNALLVESQPAHELDARHVFWPTRKPSKSSSLRSRRSRDAISLKSIEIPRPDASPLPSAVRPQLPHLTQSDALRLIQRKRKTASNISGESTPSRLRPRARLVVFYDGDAQRNLEVMVRTIGTCRNGVRKGKMTAKIDSLSRSGSSGSSSDGSTLSKQDHSKSSRFTKLDYKKTRPVAPTSAPSPGGGGGVEAEYAAFDTIDQCLEKSQSMCEKAAHQLLRDGDCSLEICTAKDHFSRARQLADAELPKLKKQAEKASKDRKEEEEEANRQFLLLQAEKSHHLKAQSQESLVTAASPISLDDKLEADLEAEDDDDDDDEEEAEFQIPITYTLHKFSDMKRPALENRLALPVL